MAIQIKRDNPLKDLTTLKIGGNADYFIEVFSEDDLCDALEFAENNDLEIFILGGGSNVVISDEGYHGLVIKLGLKGITINSNAISGETLVTAASGEIWDKLVEYCVENKLAGIECMSGIPGLVGGTPIQNVGAYGQEVSQTIIQVRCYDRIEKQFVILSSEDCEFSYRKSIFNSTQKDRYIVTEVVFSLKPHQISELTYPELIKELDIGKATLKDIRNAVIKIRSKKSMVIDEADINTRSAGSFFKNPIVAEPYFQSLVERFSGNVPHFPAGIGKIKIPAAWLIENSGFPKGFKHGNVGISANHSLALININNASAKELIELMTSIQIAVKQKYGIELTPEPVFIGTFPQLNN